MKEREIEKILVDEVKKLGGIAYKFTSPGNSGVPDRIVLLPGKRIIFAELKTDTGVLSRLQEMQIRRIQKLGHKVIVVRGISGVVDFFRLIGYPESADRICKKYRKEKKE